MKTATERLFDHLHRGGAYAHLWTDAGNRSFWFPTTDAPPPINIAQHISKPGSSPAYSTRAKAGVARRATARHRNRYRAASRVTRRIPKTWLRQNVFFSVHPLTQIPPHNVSGNRDPRYISSQLPYIAAINTLFAEYDGKDYVRLPEYASFLPRHFVRLSPVEQRKAVRAAKEVAFYLCPAQYKQRVLDEIRALESAPSVIVDSGGGYHCYWLLRDAVPVDASNRADIQATQHGWVQMVGGDPGAADLRRVLRVPGTHNMKPGFGDAPPQVQFVTCDFARLYTYSELEQRVEDWLFEQRPSAAAGATIRVNRPTNDVRQAFNDRHHIADLLTQHGYQIGFATANLTRLARPGRDASSSSVTIFPARADGAPELSVHFSSSDELYSEEYLDPRTRQVRRKAHDAFYIYVMLAHGGDWRAAYAAACAELEQTAASGLLFNQVANAPGPV